MKRVFAVVFSILSIVFLIGTYVIQYFAARRLGMVRWLNYNRGKLESAIPLDIVFYVVLAIAVVLTVFVICRIWSRRKWIGAPHVIGTVFMVLVTTAFTVVVITVNRDITPAYFLIIALFGLASITQSLCMLLSIPSQRTPVQFNKGEQLMQLSVIVPVLNEEAALPAFLDAVARWDCVYEVLFVDGGSTDATCDLLRAHTVLHGAHGRGEQCRLGASNAKGNAFVFVHADSIVPPESIRAIRNALEAGAHWGCLTLRFDEDSLGMRIAAIGSNARVRLTGVPFGDQTLFMTRTAYESVGGMPNMPIMEDYELARRLRARTWPTQLPQRVYTSARRFAEGGNIRVMLEMRRLRHLYRTGADVNELAKLYADVRRNTRKQS